MHAERPRRFQLGRQHERRAQADDDPVADDDRNPENDRARRSQLRESASRVTRATLTIATPNAAAIAIGACCTRLRASVVRTKSDVARATRSRPVMSAASRRRSSARRRHARRRRERRAHLLPVTGERDDNRAGNRQRKHDERVLRERVDASAGCDPRITSNSAANQEIGGVTCPIAVGTIMKQSTALRNRNCSRRAGRRGGVSADEQTSRPRTMTSVQNTKTAPPIVPVRCPARWRRMCPSGPPVTKANGNPDVTFTARAVPTRNVASAASFAPTIVRPPQRQRARAPSRRACRKRACPR